MPAGRPTKYEERYCQEIIDFFNKEPYETIPIEIENKEGEIVPSVATDKWGNPILKPCPLPTKEKFSFSIGVDRTTLHEWAKKHKEFSLAIKKAEDLQKDLLIQGGLVATYDKTFAIFVAKNVTDMKDRQELDVNNTISTANDWASDDDDS